MQIATVASVGFWTVISGSKGYAYRVGRDCIYHPTLVNGGGRLWVTRYGFWESS
jgi:hypothetical protein